jgi:hypothetical protein
VRLHDDLVGRNARVHVLPAHELADRDVPADAIERPDPSVQQQGGGQERARRVRSLIAAVQDTRPRYATEALLAHITVAQERRREAEETVVVQGQHDRDVRGGPEDRRGQGGKHVVAIDDVWSLPFDSPSHLVGGAWRPD